MDDPVITAFTEYPYRLPDYDAPVARRVAAYCKVNSIAMTIEQIETVLFAPEEDRLKIVKELGFAEPRVALTAMYLRWEPYQEARDEGDYDWKVSRPDYYARIATDPIDASMAFDLEPEDFEALSQAETTKRAKAGQPELSFD